VESCAIFALISFLVGGGRRDLEGVDWAVSYESYTATWMLAPEKQYQLRPEAGNRDGKVSDHRKQEYAQRIRTQLQSE